MISIIAPRRISMECILCFGCVNVIKTPGKRQQKDKTIHALIKITVTYLFPDRSITLHLCMFSYTARTYRNAYSGLSRSTWLLSVIMLINRSGTMVIPFMTLYLTSPAMGYSVGQAGFVFGLFGAGAFFGAYFGGRLTDKIGFYPVQMITLIGGGILFIVLGQMKTFPLI